MQNFIKDYISYNEFRIILLNNRINIVNYDEILEINENNISVRTNNKKIRIIGSNLVLSKLLEREILITGELSKIEVEYV